MHKTAPETAADMQQAEIPREPSQCLGITANTYMDQDGELLEILQEQARQIEVLMRDIRNLRRRSNTEARSIAAYADANIYPSSRVSKTAERCAVQRNRFLSLYSRNRHTDEEGDAVFDARLYYTGSRARRDVETFKSLYGVGRNIISMIHDNLTLDALNIWATIQASSKIRAKPCLKERYAEFIEELDRCAYTPHYNDGGASAVSRAYYGFISNWKDEVEDVEKEA